MKLIAKRSILFKRSPQRCPLKCYTMKAIEEYRTYVIALRVKTIILLNDTLDLRQLMRAYGRKKLRASALATL